MFLWQITRKQNTRNPQKYGEKIEERTDRRIVSKSAIGIIDSLPCYSILTIHYSIKQEHTQHTRMCHSFNVRMLFAYKI